jgi:predicted methyltransferase
LPPNNATTNRDGTSVEGFDPAKYQAIGESDRMTLKFRKPE